MTDDGRVKWSMGEGVTLTCPHKQARRTEPATESEPLMTGGANENKRICLESRMNQSQTEPFNDFGRETTPLDGVMTDCWPPDRNNIL